MVNLQCEQMENSRRRRVEEQQQQRQQQPLQHTQRSGTTSGATTSRMLAVLSLFLIVACWTPGAFSEYENTWNFYYEQPCCGSSPAHEMGNNINGQVPHRFHRGRYSIIIIIYFIRYGKEGELPKKCSLFSAS